MQEQAIVTRPRVQMSVSEERRRSLKAQIAYTSTHPLRQAPIASVTNTTGAARSRRPPTCQYHSGLGAAERVGGRADVCVQVVSLNQHGQPERVPLLTDQVVRRTEGTAAGAPPDHLRVDGWPAHS